MTTFLIVCAVMIVAALALVLVPLLRAEPAQGKDKASAPRAVPMAVVLMPVGVFMVQYNWHLTGSPVRMPYQHYEHKYAIAPSFLWQSMRPAPTYRSESIRRVHAEWECESYLEQKKSWLAFAQWCLWKEQILWGFFVGPILTLPLVALPAALFDRRVKLAVGILCLLLAVFVGHTFMQAHYAAPATILLIAVTVQSMRSLRTWQWRGYPAGRFLVRGTFLIWCTAPFLALWSHHAYFSRFNDSDRLQNCFHFRTEANPGDYLVASAVWRRQLVRELESRGGRHLVIVSYGPTNEPLFEWVYNEADIDAATVVWAHDLGQKANTQLTQYFRERHLWTLQINHRAVPRLIRIRAQSPDASLVKLGDRTVSLNNGQKGIP